METGLAIALVAGGLAVINPCGFALLPAFLSLQFTGEASDEPGAMTIVRGVHVGALVGAGFILVFLAAGIPIALGATFLTRYVAWLGAFVGVALILVALWTLAGRGLSVRTSLGSRGRLGQKGPFTFGLGYGAASLGCTLPVFLSVVGVGAASRDLDQVLLTFAAYALGTLSTLVVLSVAASSARDRIARRMKRLVPHMRTISGVLLLAAGIYLSFYWVQIAASGSTSLAEEDVITRFVSSIAAATERFGAEYGIALITLMIVGAAGAVAVTLRARSHR